MDPLKTVKRACHPVTIVVVLLLTPVACSAGQSLWERMFSRASGSPAGTRVAEAAPSPSQTRSAAGELIFRIPGSGPQSGGRGQEKRIRDVFAPPKGVQPASRGRRTSSHVGRRHHKLAKGVSVTPSSVASARSVWKRLIGDDTSLQPQVQYFSSSYSLKLDPNVYTVLPTQTGGSILVDSRKKLPSLVKSLLLERYPDLVIVSESPSNRKAFYRSLLAAGEFFSTEENFSVSFGTDPKIVVDADFKIEKEPDSLLKQDVVLLNVGKRPPLPVGIRNLLADNGFRVIEASPVEKKGLSPKQHSLHEITSRDPDQILDDVLDALSLAHVRKKVALFVDDDVGVRLEVPVDRFFRYKGQHFVALRLSDDPNSETLIRLLEAQGHRVILLREGDDLRAITDKLFLSMNLNASFSEYELWPHRDKGYGVTLSGVLIRDKINGNKIFLTDREISPQIREMVGLNGYRVLLSK